MWPQLRGYDKLLYRKMTQASFDLESQIRLTAISPRLQGHVLHKTNLDSHNLYMTRALSRGRNVELTRSCESGRVKRTIHGSTGTSDEMIQIGRLLSWAQTRLKQPQPGNQGTSGKFPCQIEAIWHWEQFIFCIFCLLLILIWFWS